MPIGRIIIDIGLLYLPPVLSDGGKNYPEEIAAMPYGYSMRSLTLLHHWDETFDQKKWDKLISRVSFHKLAFRVDKKTKENKNNFYNYILNTNKEIGNGRI